MNNNTTSFKLFCVAVASLIAIASAQQPSPPIIRAKVVLGVDGIANDSSGELSIQDDALVFSRRDGPKIRVPLTAIQEAFLTQQDKQVGGTPMALGRAAAPYGGGRVISLFSHKKYDFVTVEYVDSNEGFHGSIYQLDNGDGQVLAKELSDKGVRVTGLRSDNAKTGMENANAK